MADHTKEEVLALAEEYEHNASILGGRGDPEAKSDAVIAAALRAYAEAMSAGPVAWQWLTVDGWVGKDGTTEEYARSMAGPKGRARAIYAAPPAREIGEANDG